MGEIHPFYLAHRDAMEAAMRQRLDLAEGMLRERAGLSDMDGIRQEVMREQAAQSHAKEYPGDFVYDFVEPGPGQDFDFGIDYKACGFCKFAARHGDQDILPHICGLDFEAYATRGIRLERTQTLAGGSSHCDFRFSRKPE